MLIRRCDRCGVEYGMLADYEIDGYDVDGIMTVVRVKNGTEVVRQRAYDLCPDCLKSLDDWLRNKAPADTANTDESKEI